MGVDQLGKVRRQVSTALQLFEARFHFSVFVVDLVEGLQLLLKLIEPELA